MYLAFGFGFVYIGLPWQRDSYTHYLVWFGDKIICDVFSQIDSM